MASANALTDSVALSLFRNIKQGIENSQIADLNTVQTEIDAAIAELNSKRLTGEQTQIHDLVGKMFLEIGSLHEKVAKCETQLSDFQRQASVLKEDTTQTVARVEACGVLVEQQKEENAKVLAAMAEMKTSTSVVPVPRAAPVASSSDAIQHHVPPRVAVVSFPGGPRTVTIHPPGSSSYQPIVHDEKGDAIIDFRRTKPLRREGAFRGPLEEVDWHEITRVYGRGPEPSTRAAPPCPRWPDRSQPSTHIPCRNPSDLIVRQRQLSLSLHTDAFGRVLGPERLHNPRLLSLPAGVSSAGVPFPDSQPFLSGERDGSSPMPSSPSAGRGTKRVLKMEDEGVTGHEVASLSTDPRMAREPITPRPIKREDDCPEGGGKRKRFRPAEGSLMTNGSLSPTV